MNSRVMVLWSGGVESTSLLKHLLESAVVPVVAHHLRHINPDGRVTAEDMAIAKLSPMLRKIREFEYSSSELSICNGAAFGMDYAVQYPIGLIAMRHHHCGRLFRAGCLEDDWDKVNQPSGRYVYTRESDVPGFSHERRARALSGLMRPGENANKIVPYLQFYKNPKAWHWLFLGNLAQWTWSCRRPRLDLTPCGKCHACKEREAAAAGSSVIPEIRDQLAKAKPKTL